MKHMYIAANWKSNKTVSESLEWLNSFAEKLSTDSAILTSKDIIVCVPYTDLYALSEMRHKLALPISLGAQDVSPFPDGAYTGQISARMIRGMADWVIIGHSERRKYFRETEEELNRKTEQVKKEGLRVIYCVSEAGMQVPPAADIVAYEPLWAIGTGKTDTPENAGRVLITIKEKSGVGISLYGGSVTSENAAAFLSQPGIDGVLIGGASLDAGKFLKLLESLRDVAS
ncbi:hypothetical protein A2Z33_05330 [Candidatus Gottesmanbacteria bacterium RBG_16_52_11]|uniref:Triosephosphate isomerase n=1 Tax=Candidatus Gottesmanbacteria bacterium RBG_16_52_11 TaxID=1798374 RepID=A0A1F5YMW3_9BACT|nr:MAG: hypothetical protein A2Z33_05330 [Candidatus Gottesmanbacteria bacterium RBG_16_52_11]